MEPASKGTGKRPSILAGVGWMATGQFGSQAINFLSNWVLLVFLDPKDFGIMALAWAFAQILNSMVDFGTGLCVIQSEEIHQELLDTAFTISLALAAAASLFLLGVGWVVDHITLKDFDPHVTAAVLWEIAPACFFGAFVTVPSALLLRGMRLDAYARIDLSMNITRASTSIALAASGFGVHSIVIGFYAGSLVHVVLARRAAGVRTHLRIHPAERKRIVHNGLRLTAYSLLSTALVRADAFVLTPLIGQQSLGIFTFGRQLVLQPVEMAGSITRTVLLPKLARLQRQPQRARFFYLRADQFLCSTMMPVLVCAAMLIDLATGALGKDKWAGVGTVATALLAAAVANLLLQSPTSLMMANGRTGQMFRWGVLRGAISISAFVLGSFYGGEGVALALGLALLVAMPWLLRPTASLLSVSWRVVFSSAAAPLPAAATCAGAVWLVRMLLEASGAHPLVTLALAGASGMLAFAAMAWFTRIPAWGAARRILRRRRARRSKALAPSS